jgi:hypothetical protein
MNKPAGGGAEDGGYEDEVIFMKGVVLKDVVEDGHGFGFVRLGAVGLRSGSCHAQLGSPPGLNYCT